MKAITRANKAIKNLEDQRDILKKMLAHTEAMERIIADFNAWARVEFPREPETDIEFWENIARLQDEIKAEELDHEDVKWQKYLGEDYQ